MKNHPPLIPERRVFNECVCPDVHGGPLCMMQNSPPSGCRKRALEQELMRRTKRVADTPRCDTLGFDPTRCKDHLEWMHLAMELERDWAAMLAENQCLRECLEALRRATVREAIIEECADLADQKLDHYSGTECTYRCDVAEAIRALK